MVPSAGASTERSSVVPIRRGLRKKKTMKPVRSSRKQTSASSKPAPVRQYRTAATAVSAAAPAMNGNPSAAMGVCELLIMRLAPQVWIAERPGEGTGNANPARPLRKSAAVLLVLGLVDDLGLGDPGHHGAEPGPHILNLVLGTLAAQGVEDRLVGLVLQHPLLGKLAVLDLGEDLLHLFLGLGSDDPRSAGQVAVLGRVGYRIAHVGDATFVDQVNDQLGFVQALEICHLRCVARLHQGLEACLDQGGDATAENRLLAEEIGLGLFLEIGFDDAGPAATDGRGVGEGHFLGVTLGVVVNGDEARNTAPLGVLVAYQVTRSLGGDHDDVD